MRRLHPSIVSLVVLGLLVAVPAARAQDVRFEVSPYVGYRMGGSFDAADVATGGSRSADLDDDAGWGIDFGLYRDATSFYELLYSRQATGIGSKDPALSGVDVTTEYFQFGGTVLYPQEQWAVPYLSFTLGATRLSADGFSSETKFSGSLGGGLRLPFNDNFAATLGVRGYLTLVESDTDFFCKSINGEASCLVRSSGNTMFQVEALVGITARF